MTRALPSRVSVTPAVPPGSPGMSVLLITHYPRLLNHIEPDRVHVMYRGRIVQSGAKELALEIEARGYDFLREAFAPAAG